MQTRCTAKGSLMDRRSGSDGRGLTRHTSQSASRQSGRAKRHGARPAMCITILYLALRSESIKAASPAACVAPIVNNIKLYANWFRRTVPVTDAPKQPPPPQPPPPPPSSSQVVHPPRASKVQAIPFLASRQSRHLCASVVPPLGRTCARVPPSPFHLVPKKPVLPCYRFGPMWALHQLKASQDVQPYNLASSSQFTATEIQQFPVLSTRNFWCIQRHQATGGRLLTSCPAQPGPQLTIMIYVCTSMEGS